jgi:hypothetical protein
MARQLRRTINGLWGSACMVAGLLVVSAGSFALAACSSDEGGDSSGGAACVSDSDCKLDRICIDGRCEFPTGGSTGAAGSASSSVSGARVVADNDANDDGVLTSDEAPPDIQASFSQMDANGDGVLTASEIDQAGMSGSAASVINTATQGASAAATTASAFSGEICAEGEATVVRVAPQVVLLLDGSSSMAEPYSGNMSRWQAMRQAIVDPNTGVVSTMEGMIEFALVIYNGPMAGMMGGGGGQCPISLPVVAPALNNYQAIEQAFPRSEPGVFTPTGEALELVCFSLPGADQDVRPQYVILATDGNPNSCNVDMGQLTGGEPPADYQSVIDAANYCCERGVTVYVVSLASGGPEYEAHLQEIANIAACTGAVGAGTVYSPQDPGRLANDLSQLIGGAMTCEVYLDGSVTQGKECEGSVVTLNGRVLPCNDPNGWILVSESVIALQGQACDEFTKIPDSVVTATFPCEIFVPGGGGPGGGSGGPGGGSAGSGSGGGAAGSGSGGPSGLQPIF